MKHSSSRLSTGFQLIGIARRLRWRIAALFILACLALLRAPLTAALSNNSSSISSGAETSGVISQEKKSEKGKSPQKKKAGNRNTNPKDARNKSTGKNPPARDPKYAPFGIYGNSAPRAKTTEPVSTQLPLNLRRQDRIALVGNTLFERAAHFGYFEAVAQTYFPKHKLQFRNLAWSADTPELQPRPANFADLTQHLTYEKIDIIIAAYGFNESFAGRAGAEKFHQDLSKHVSSLKTKAFNGTSGPRIVLVSPIANENIQNVPAADRNNAQIKDYVQVIEQVAKEQQVAFVDLFSPTLVAMTDPDSDLTINGCHLNDLGYQHLSQILFRKLFQQQAPQYAPAVVEAIRDKNRQYLRRFRPLNTFYYTGGRNKSYGYLDFLPAMRNFEVLVDNREHRIWDIVGGKDVPAKVDDGNLPVLPPVAQSRGANRWMSAEQERSEFVMDPRFEVNLFAGEEQFPDIAAPIQMRWDALGRLWVSCSTSYPHVYPGNEANDKLVILEDVDGDGRADKSTVFADDLHIPLSFEFGDGGVYVSEMPDLTFLKDTDGDGKADVRRRVLSGFGTEDSHHSLHDFAWTPDGDLLIRDSIFLHSQIETPYGPVRMQNSGWFRFQPRTHRLTSFGSYPSTNPWGVTFDDWGQHVASHPIYAQAFHALSPPYPEQHRAPSGLRAYSGTCGQEFVDFLTYPQELQGSFIKVRYKPTNRVEIHKWNEQEFGYDEEYIGDLLFSKNLSFIPVDIRFGPRGALYVCDWYNPIKGHAQYALRDERRDRHSGRIWRITAKGRPLQRPPKIADATIPELLDNLKRREYRYRYWTKRELRGRDAEQVAASLDRWVEQLNTRDPRRRHHQLEALWVYRSIDAHRGDLLRELIGCDHYHARAAAVKQLAFWHKQLPDAESLLRKAANDPKPLVRMEAAIAASYIGTPAAYESVLEILKHPYDAHLEYALTCSLGSEALRPYWESQPPVDVTLLLKQSRGQSRFKEPKKTAAEARYDRQPLLKTVKISCVPERMQFTVGQFVVKPGQPMKIVFTNPDATDHNLVFVQEEALAEVGMAANEMARDPRNAVSDFIPREKQSLILANTPMIGPTKSSLVHVLRFSAPTEPGIYPYVCTFPGHWVVMNGLMVVARNDATAQTLLDARKPQVIRKWQLSDFSEVTVKTDEQTVMAGMQAYVKARCNQCHIVAGHGINLGPDLTDVHKRFQGQKLLKQVLEPSSEIHKEFTTHKFLLKNGQVLSGVITKETANDYHVVTNLLLPKSVTRIRKKQVEHRALSTISAMPEGLLDVLTKEEILSVLGFMENGGYQLPPHLEHGHDKHKQP